MTVLKVPSAQDSRDRSSGAALHGAAHMKASAFGASSGKRETKSSMTLKEALRVKWLQSRPRSIGELLDEGYLDSARLEWAAQRAYKPELKEAAQVILAWQSGQREPIVRDRGGAAEDSKAKKKPARLGLSLEEARSTLWPFSPLRGRPMGELSDTRQLSLKDLAYAVENAWDDRVRQASVALLLLRLDQELEEPKPKAGGLRVVSSGRSFAERSQLRLSFIQGSIAGAGLAMSVMYLIWSIPRSKPSANAAGLIANALSSPEGILGLILFLIVVAVILALAVVLPNKVLAGLDKQIDAYHRGQEAEDGVVEKALRSLDGKWILFRNVVVPGRRRADVDIVVVGPPGVWAIEVKSWQGQYRNVGDAWTRLHRGGWKKIRKSPSTQARRSAASLARFLEAEGLKLYVQDAVAWMTDEGSLDVENPSVRVWTMERLEDEFANLSNGRPLEPSSQARIVEKLTKLCEAQCHEQG